MRCSEDHFIRWYEHRVRGERGFDFRAIQCVRQGKAGIIEAIEGSVRKCANHYNRMHSTSGLGGAHHASQEPLTIRTPNNFMKKNSIGNVSMESGWILLTLFKVKHIHNIPDK